MESGTEQERSLSSSASEEHLLPAKRARSESVTNSNLDSPCAAGGGVAARAGPPARLAGARGSDMDDSEVSDDERLIAGADPGRVRTPWLNLNGCRTLEDVRARVHARFRTSQELLDYVQTSQDTRLVKLIPLLMQRPRQRLPHVHSLDHACKLLSESKNILVLTGAGVSVSAGIPDFRSSDGIYRRLRDEFGMPKPECMFDKEYFDRNPQPFFSFAHELWPGRFNPTPCHRFIALLEKRGQLLRNYSQNIDTLEQSAGITRLVNCHGSFATATCVTCGYRCAGADIEDDILNQRIALCPKCPPHPPPRPVNQVGESSGGLGCSSEGAGGSSGGGSSADGVAAAADPGADGGNVLASSASDKAAARESAPEESKLMRDPMEEQDLASMGLASRGVMKPDIVFFKESLPTNFFASLRDDMQAVDLLVVIGTSLRVAPVSDIVGKVDDEVPALLINREVVGQPNEFDVELLGNCDAVVSELVARLGWDQLHIPSTSSPLKRWCPVRSQVVPADEPPATDSAGGPLESPTAEQGVGVAAHREEAALLGATESGSLTDREIIGRVQEEVSSGSIVQYGPCTYLFEGFVLAEQREYASMSDQDEEDEDEVDDDDNEDGPGSARGTSQESATEGQNDDASLSGSQELAKEDGEMQPPDDMEDMDAELKQQQAREEQREQQRLRREAFRATGAVSVADEDLPTAGGVLAYVAPASFDTLPIPMSQIIGLHVEE